MIACMDRTGGCEPRLAILMARSLFGSGIPVPCVDCPSLASITCSTDGGVNQRTAQIRHPMVRLCAVSSTTFCCRAVPYGAALDPLPADQLLARALAIGAREPGHIRRP